MTVIHSPGFKNFNFMGIANFCPTSASLWVAVGQSHYIDVWHRGFEPRILMKDFPQGWPQFVYFCQYHGLKQIKIGYIEKAEAPR